jgi:predicted permease
LRTFWNLAQVDLGFAVEQRVEARLSPSWRELPGRPQIVALYDRVLERLGALPGVESVGAINALPLVGANMWRTSVFTDGQDPDDDERPNVGYRAIAGDYFDALGIELVQGRYLDRGDVAGAQPVVVLSRGAAQAIWPEQDALGRELWLVPEEHPEHRRHAVVGIVEDVIDDSLTRAPMPLVYFNLPQAQWGHFQDWGTSFVVSAAGDAAALVAPVRSAVEESAAGLPVFGVQTFAERLAGALAPSRFNLVMLACLGAVALALAGLGVYGVMGFMVAQRRREIGTRVALGAGSNQVVRLVVARGVGLATAGVATGLLGAYAAQGMLESLLFGVEPTDPLSYAGIALTLLAVAMAASLIPARRAAGIDPMICMRQD